MENDQYGFKNRVFESAYFCCFLIIAFLFVLFRTGKLVALVTAISVLILGAGIHFAGGIRRSYVQGAVFLLYFLGIAHSRYLDLFAGMPYNLLIFSLLTVLNALVIAKKGMKYDLLERNRSNGILRSLCLVLMTFMFFGFQVRDIAEEGSWLQGGLLILSLFWWTAGFYNMVCMSIRRLLREKGRFITQDNDCSPAALRSLWLAVFLIIAVTGAVFSIAFYPGIITPDSFVNYRAALEFDNLELRSDLHSFAYILLTKLILVFSDNYYLLTLFMIVSFSAVWASYMQLLYRSGVKKWVVVIISLIWISIPGNVYMLFCTWKDMPFAVCMLLFSLMCVKFSLYGSDPVGIKDALIAALSLFGIAAFRSNGQVVMLVMWVLALTGYLLKRIDKKIFLTIAMSVILLAFFKGPIFQLLKVQPSLEGFAAVPFIDGVWENVHAGNKLDDGIIAFIEDELLEFDDFKKEYAEEYTNIYVFRDGYDHINLKNAQDCYFWCLRHYPSTTLLARLKRTYNIWSVFPSRTYYAERMYYAKLRDWGELYPEYSSLKYVEEFEGGRQIVDAWYSDDHLMGSIGFFIGRCGWNCVLWMMIGIELLRKKRGMGFIPIVPALVNALGLFIGCCFPDMRYFYPMFVLSVPFYVYVFLYSTKDHFCS